MIPEQLSYYLIGWRCDCGKWSWRYKTALEHWRAAHLRPRNEAQLSLELAAMRVLREMAERRRNAHDTHRDWRVA